MVKEIIKGNKKLFRCDVCGLKYLEKEIAVQCEAFCKTHPNLCDPKIAEKSVDF